MHNDNTMKKIEFYTPPVVRTLPVLASTAIAASPVYGGNGIEIINDQYHDAEDDGFEWY